MGLMITLLKIVLVIALLLILIRRKVDLGLALALDSLLVAVLFGLRPRPFGRAVLEGLTSPTTLELVGIVLLVLYLGQYLQAGDRTRRMVDSLRRLVRDPRLILAIPSAVLGLLPMMAGAMMGAPIVEEAARRWNLSPAWKTFYNYWFRHIWEYFWPLYLNIILASTIFRIPIATLCLYQFPFTVLAAGTGLVILFRNVPPGKTEITGRSGWRDVWGVVLGLWPILLTIVLVFAAGLKMLVALAVSALLTQLLSRSRLAERWAVLRAGFSPRIALLTAALMVFKRILETSGALDDVARVVDPAGASGYILLFAAPFLVALLTGVNQAFVAITFPLLVPIVGTATPDPFLALFAYVSGFTGILISPTHLCLALTADYFKADLRDVYRILAGPVVVVFGAALIALVASRLF
jgi:integral membrane protein (TIGR00529 family)